MKKIRLCKVLRFLAILMLFLAVENSIFAQNTPFDVENVNIPQSSITESAEKTGTVTSLPEIGEIPSVWGSTDTLVHFIQAAFGIEASSDTASWEASELHMAGQVLKTLPPYFRQATTGIIRVKAGRSSGVAGYVEMNVAPIVHITDVGAYYKVFSGYLVHEMTHCFQMSHKDILNKWEDRFWDSFLFWSDPNTPSVSDYGNTNPKEDMAESMRKYWEDGPYLKRNYPDRYEFLKTYVMNGVEYEKPNKE
jgi:hypothetical protein